jgi:hypothetical protein
MAINHSRATPLFALKDDMSANNPDKVLSGVPFDAEFQAIIDSFTLAATDANPSFTGTASFDVVTTTGSVTIGGNLTVEGAVIEDTSVNPSLSGSYALGSNTAAILHHTSSGDLDYTDSIVEGQSVTLMLNNSGDHAITWPANIKWVGGYAPDLDTTSNTFNVLSVWKSNNILFGSWGGSVDAS